MTLATPTSAEPPRPPIQKQASAEFALSLGSRRREAGAPVRTIFVADEDATKPPLARLLSSAESGGGGRGGQLRIKLYLSLLWVAAREPYTVTRPSRAWAALLGLDDIDTKGVRRVQEAFRDLRERRFIDLADGGGLPSQVTLLSEAGDGSSFMPAPEAYNRLRVSSGNDVAVLLPHRYFRVPSALWTEGHIARLRGPSLAMLLVLLAEQRGNNVGVWFSPDRAERRYGLSASTRTEGLAHLRALGLVSSKIQTVSESGAFIDFARRRKVHKVIGLKGRESSP